MALRDYSIITNTNPKSPISEAYRILRTNIQFSNVDQALKTILFTSAGPAEGKSSTVVNLAHVMAQAGKNVLIIDADLRKPAQHKIFGLENLKGLSNTLIGEASLAHAVKTDQEGLSIMTSGPIPPNPAELLGSKRMKQVIQVAVNTYDIVLIDSPPIIAVTDASVLAQNMDGVILVLAAGEVTREYAVQAKERLDKVGAKIIGTVLNKVDMKSKEQYYYYYHYYGEGDEGGRPNKKRK
jgi:capsular exopolysaccharide synthesis family protein